MVCANGENQMRVKAHGVLAAVLLLGLVGCDIGFFKNNPGTKTQQQTKKRAKEAPSDNTPHRRGTGVVAKKPEEIKPPVVDPEVEAAKLKAAAKRDLYIRTCDGTLKEMEALILALDLTIADLERQTKDVTPESKNQFMQFLVLQLERCRGSKDTIELLTANVRNLKSQAGNYDNMVHLDRELQNRIQTLEEVKDSIPGALVDAAKRKMKATRAAVKETPKASEPPKAKKTYTLKDGRVLKVLSEVASGDKVIVRTIQGEIITIGKEDIKQEEKQQ